MIKLLNTRFDYISLQEGESLIKTLYMAMDPATRGWMSDSGGYLEPLALDKPVMGVIIGEVIATR